MIEAGGSQGLHGRQSWRLAFDDGRHQTGLAVALERLPAGHHLEEHRAKREHVGSRIDRSPLDLLRRHVLHRAEDQPAIGQLATRVQRGLASPRRRCRQSDPEVEQLGATLGQHDVARLDVAVDEAGAVGAVEGTAISNRTGKGLIAGERALLQPRRQRLALEVSMTRKSSWCPGRRATRDRCRATCRCGGDSARPPRALHVRGVPGLRVAGDVRRQQLQCYGAGQSRVARPVDFAHPSGAQRRDDFVGTKPGSGRQGHECHLSGKRRLTAGL